MFKFCIYIYDKLFFRILNLGLCYIVMIYYLGKCNLWFSLFWNEMGWFLGWRLWCLWLCFSFYMERLFLLCFKLNVVFFSDFCKIGDLCFFIRWSICMKMIYISDINWYRCYFFFCKRNNLNKRFDVIRVYWLR